MANLLYELKKRWKQKITFFVFMTALALSIIAILIIPKTPYDSSLLTTNVFQYNPTMFLQMESASTLPDGSFSSRFSSDWQMLMGRHEIPIQQNIDLPENVFTSATTFIPSTELYRSIETLWEKHRFEVSPLARDDIEFAIHLHDYYSEQGINRILPPIYPNTYLGVEPTVLPHGIFETLTNNTNLFFGIIPLAFFFFLGFTTFTQEYQSTKHYFQWIQPVSKIKVFFSQYLSIMLQALIFLTSIVFCVSLLELLRGGGVGLHDLPIRIYMDGVKYYPQWQFILISMGLFLLKLSLFTSLGISLAMMIKLFDVGIFASAFIGIIGFYLTRLWDNLQVTMNPLYINYESTLLGGRLEMSGEITGYPYISAPPAGHVPFLIFFLLSIVILVIAYQFRYKTPIRMKTEHSRPISSSFHFELRKYFRLMPPKWIGAGLIAISLIIYLGMVLPDQEDMSNKIKMYLIEAEHQDSLIEIFEQSYSEFEASDMDVVHKSQMLGSIQADLESAKNKARLYRDISNDIQNSNSTGYYKNLMKEMKERLTPNKYALSISELENRKLSNFSTDVMRERFKWSAQKNVKPLIFPSFEISHTTIYDKSASNKSIDVMQAEFGQPIDTSSGMIIYRLIHYYQYHLLCIASILIFFGGNYFLERSNENSINSLYTQPKTKVYFYNRKWFAGVFLSLLLAIFVFGTLMVVGLFSRSSDTWHIPILHYDKIVADPFIVQDFSDSYHFKSLGVWIIQAIALFLVILLSSNTMMHSLSVKIKNRWLVFVMVFGVGYLAMTVSPSLMKLAPYLPFSYWNISGLLNGRSALEINSSLTLINGLIVNIGWAIVWYILGWANVRKT